MMVAFAIITSLLVASTWGFPDTFQQLPENYDNSHMFPEDYSDGGVDLIQVERRDGSGSGGSSSGRSYGGNNFLRFGRKDRSDFDEDYGDYDFARPTRSGGIDRNTDYFIRFGRSKQDFLRFGRGGNSDHLRFGRATTLNVDNDAPTTTVTTNSRVKRDVKSSDFLRFGRNSNFLRFGRTNPHSDYMLSTLLQVLNEILKTLKSRENDCKKL